MVTKFPELETRCTHYECKAGYLAGRTDKEGFPIPCPKCGGTGKVLTEEGRQLLEFLRKYFVEVDA